MYDIYRSKNEPDERMAVPKGAGLSDHVETDDWKLMTGLTNKSPELHAVDEADIAERGFCYFKLVEIPE